MPIINQASGASWTSLHGDCCEALADLPDNSIDYTVTSLPFKSLFVYSDHPADMGNCKDDDEFWDHFGFLVPQLLRITVPGRLCSIHSMQMPTTKERHGYIGISDFPGDIVRAFCGGEAADMHAAMRHIEKRMEKAALEQDESRLNKLTVAHAAILEDLRNHPAQEGGWIYHSRVIIWKDPLVAASRTKALGLAHKQIVKDSARCRQGIADYLDTFAKPTDEWPKPVNHHAKTAGFDKFIGENPPHGEQRTNNPRTNKHSHAIWRRYASPVWNDIDQTNTLNARVARDSSDEVHLCPLQLDVLERCIDLWTNPGDVVFDPFGGIASTGHQAVKMGRKALMCELKESYFRVGVNNLILASNEYRNSSRTLFDLEGEPAPVDQSAEAELAGTME